MLTTTIVVPPCNASKWQMGFNSAFKGLSGGNQVRGIQWERHVKTRGRCELQENILFGNLNEGLLSRSRNTSYGNTKIDLKEIGLFVRTRSIQITIGFPN